MKITPILLLICLLTVSARAEYRMWTRKDGKTAELDLISVTEAKGEKTGKFKMRDGSPVMLKASVLTDEDAKLLNEWKPKPTAAQLALESVYDTYLDGNLVVLDHKALKPVKDFHKPSKYYLFYYATSTSDTCVQYTPELVDFYNESKNEKFEIILITHDTKAEDMEGFAKELNVPWPQLKLSEVEKFRDKFKNPEQDVPSLVLTDLKGNILKTSYEGEEFLGPVVVTEHLQNLLNGKPAKK